MSYPTLVFPINTDDHLFRDGTDIHEKELYRFEEAYRALGSPEGKKVLDIGSYPGTAAVVFCRGNYYSAFGFFNTQYVEALKRCHIPFMEGDLESYRDPVDADIIIFTEIFEHLRQPYKALKNLRAMMKPGARCYLTTNNASYYGYILKLIFNRDTMCSIATEGSWYPGHMRYYGLEELARELTALGFVVESNRFINFLPKIRYYRSRSFAAVKNTLGAILPERYATNIELIFRKPH